MLTCRLSWGMPESPRNAFILEKTFNYRKLSVHMQCNLESAGWLGDIWPVDLYGLPISIFRLFCGAAWGKGNIGIFSSLYFSSTYLYFHCFDLRPSITLWGDWNCACIFANTLFLDERLWCHQCTSCLRASGIKIWIDQWHLNCRIILAPLPRGSSNLLAWQAFLLHVLLLSFLSHWPSAKCIKYPFQIFPPLALRLRVSCPEWKLP